MRIGRPFGVVGEARALGATGRRQVAGDEHAALDAAQQLVALAGLAAVVAARREVLDAVDVVERHAAVDGADGLHE